MSSDHDAQNDEMLALESIFDTDEFCKKEDSDEFSGHFKAFVSLPGEIKIEYKFLPFVNKRKKRMQQINDDTQNLNHISVKFLPPLELSFTLPPDYPSTSPPRFTLVCSWLTRAQLSKLCVKLDSLWNDNKGQEILYLWLSFLKEESYSFLGLGSTLNLSRLYSSNMRLLEKTKKLEKVEAAESAGSAGSGASHSGSNSNSGASLHSCNDIGQAVPSGSGSPVKGRGRGRGRGKSKIDHLKRPGSSSVMIDSSPVPALVESDTQSDERKMKAESHSNGTKMMSRLQNMEITDDGKNSVQSTFMTQHHAADEISSKPKTSLHKSRLGNLDQRAVSCNSLQTSLIEYIVDYNQTLSQKEFQRNIYLCRICFDDKPGSNCFQFPECRHVFCRECVSSYFEISIKDGQVHALTCPEEGCKSEAFHSQIYELVSPELFSRYDELLLSSTLDGMVDIVYCPRKTCQYPVTCDPDEKMAQCAHCSFSFCILCRMGYHGVDPCRIKIDSGLIAEYEAATVEKKRLMEKKYGRKQIQDLIETCYSEQWIKGNSKSCPHCNAAIEKSDGCNKMICWKCNTFFCWICKSRLHPDNPYKHFNSPTSACFNLLFHGLQEQSDDSDSDIDLDDDDDDDIIGFL